MPIDPRLPSAERTSEVSKTVYVSNTAFFYMYREEELYQILIDIMRSPEMIKALCGSSLKKKLQ